MRSFIRMSAAVLALFVVANVATAQGGGRGGPPGQRTADQLLTGITLTADQTAKLAPIVKTYDEDFAKLPRWAAAATWIRRPARRRWLIARSSARISRPRSRPC